MTRYRVSYVDRETGVSTIIGDTANPNMVELLTEQGEEADFEVEVWTYADAA